MDWDTNNSSPRHYDARVVRNCNPGHEEESDPHGNLWWQEPNDYDEADVDGVQRAGSYVFKDDDLDTILNHSNAYGGPPAHALPTSSYAQRIRTLYDDGSVASHEHYPVRCNVDATWVGFPFSSSGTCV